MTPAPPVIDPMAQAIRDQTAAPRPVFKPGEALAAAKDAFKALSETPRPAEVSNAAALMKYGKSAEEAVAAIIKAR